MAVEKGLRLWGGPRRAAIKGYERFIADGKEQGHREEYYEVKLQRYLGEDEFVEAVERALEPDEEDRPVKITMAEVVQEIIRESGQDIAAILSKGRGRIGSRLRAEAVYAAREAGGIPLTAAAKYLRRDLRTLSLAVKRLEETIQKDSKLRRRLKEISARLRQGHVGQYQISKA